MEKGVPAKRLVIHVSDICLVTGKSQKYAQNLIKEIREKYQIQKEHYVTIKNFCDYKGLDETEVRKVIPN